MTVSRSKGAFSMKAWRRRHSRPDTHQGWSRWAFWVIGGGIVAAFATIGMIIGHYATLRPVASPVGPNRAPEHLTSRPVHPSLSPSSPPSSTTSSVATPTSAPSPSVTPSWNAAQWLALLSPDESDVVKITTYGNMWGSVLISGSGFFTDGYLITCYHVVDHAHYYIDVWFHGGAGPYYAKVVATDPASDLAALKLDNGMDPGNLPLGTVNTASIGEPIAVVGHPGGGSLYITPGTLTATQATISVNGYGTLSPMLLLQVAAIGGDSGGPVFNTAGDVIGVLEDGSTGIAGEGGAVPVSSLTAFLDSLSTIPSNTPPSATSPSPSP